MKKPILLLLFTLLFTGCVERGYAPKPITASMAKPIKKQIVKQPTLKTAMKKAKSKMIQIKNTPLIEEKKVVEKTMVTPAIDVKKTTVEKDDLFTLTEDTKNKISGFFIIIIGIIILL